MIVRFLNRIRRRLGIGKAALSWAKHGSVLKSFTTQHEFQAYVRKLQPKLFAHYEGISPVKRLEFTAVIDHVGSELQGKAILDIGPGFGDSLDICQERGARSIHFVENDPFFFTHNRLKGYAQGHSLDHLRELEKIEAGPFDLIWIAGALTADLFMKGEYPVTLPKWLSDVDRLAAPSSRTVLCPFWLHGDSRRFVEDVAGSSFSRGLQRHGYDILPSIPGTHCSTTTAPIWFCRCKPSA